ncbi:MAG: ubiquinol-cytochrome c reductase iron-sulfur subunit [Syntrophales bacterium]
MPETIESTRRDFLKLSTGILLLVNSVVLGIPLIGSFVGPSFRRPEEIWMKETAVSDLQTEQPVILKTSDEKVDAYLHETVVRRVWAVRHPDGDVTVFSPICPHLGCRYNWDPSSRHFVCPCHGSIYSIDGKVLGGPAPRPLDTLPSKVEQGILYVKWERFEVGIPRKIRV